KNIKQNVAAFAISAICKASAILEKDMTVKAEARRSCCGLARVIGLGCALGDDGVGAFRKRIAHQEFELSCLVAAGRESCRIVALNPDAGTLEVLGKAIHGLERGGQMCKPYAWKARKMHGAGLSA